MLQPGIRHVFGMVGSANAHIFDSIAAKGFTDIICVHHEQAACLATLAYYRICGTLYAAIVTDGPGSTNAITGLVSAWMDSIPCLVISGNDHSRFTVETSLLRTHSFWIEQCNLYQKKYPNLSDKYIDKDDYINSYQFIHTGFNKVLRRESPSGYSHADQIMRGGILKGSHHGMTQTMLEYIYHSFKEFENSFANIKTLIK